MKTYENSTPANDEHQRKSRFLIRVTIPVARHQKCLETTSDMNQTTCILVAVATKSLRARWKSSHWHEQKHMHTSREKWNTKTVCRNEVHQRSAAEKQNDYLPRGRVMFWILICALSLWYHLSSQKSKERKGIRFFNKSNGVSILCRRSVYVAMELWKVPQKGHFVFVIFKRFEACESIVLLLLFGA